MWFLIKAAFWFTLVLVMLPFFDNESAQKLENAPKVATVDTVMAAAGAINYMTKICADRPYVCEKGGETITALGYRAKEGARIAYRLIDDGMADAPAIQPMPEAATDPITTATVIPIPQKRPDRHD